MENFRFIAGTFLRLLRWSFPDFHFPSLYLRCPSFGYREKFNSAIIYMEKFNSATTFIMENI
jgi:hypothetical protein